MREKMLGTPLTLIIFLWIITIQVDSTQLNDNFGAADQGTQ